MPSSPDSELDDLRRAVDRLDEAMVDLLVERLGAVRAIADIKRRTTTGQPAIRPGREAVILRRLVARAGDGFPAGTLVRMWRELLAATTRAQAPLAIAACVPATQPELWDIARDHFGSMAPIQRTEGCSHALRLVADGAAHLAVLPLPGELEPWWAQLVDTTIRPLRVLAKLPFGSATSYPEGSGAYVVGAMEPDPSGADMSLLAIETTENVGRARLLAGMGASSRWLATRRCPDRGLAQHLIELEGFHSSREPLPTDALSTAREHVLRSTWLGSYARPLPTGN